MSDVSPFWPPWVPRGSQPRGKANPLPPPAGLDDAFLSSSGSVAAWKQQPPARPLGVANYGFLPVNGWNPVISIRPGGALRNCRPYFWKSPNGVRRYTIYADRYDTGNESTGGYETAWTGDALDDTSMRQVAVIATKDDLASQLGGAIQSVSIGGTVYNDGDGLYHHFLCAVDSWATVSQGGIYRFTSPNPDEGPWAFAGKVLDSGDYANRTPVDNSTPVWHPGLGKWFMVWMDYTSDSFPSRQMVYGVADDMTGPWTKVGGVVNRGGYSLIFDGGECHVEEGRVYCWVCVDDYMVWVYDFTDPANAYTVGPAVDLSYRSDQNGDPGVGRGGVCRVDDEFYITYQAKGSGGAARYAGYAMRGVPGSRMIYRQASADFFVNNQSLTNGATYDLPSVVPPNAVMIDVAAEVSDTGVPSAGAYAVLDGGYGGFPYTFRVQAQNAVYTQRYAVTLKPDPAGKKLHAQVVGIASGKVWITCYGYWSLPA